MKDLRLKAQIFNDLERMQLPRHLVQKLDDQRQAQEVQAMLQALNTLDQQWH